MDRLILGIDLSDTSTLLAYYGFEEHFSYPTAICRTNQNNEWKIGEDAYECILSGKGILTDKLFSLLIKEGYTTIYDFKYTAEHLLEEFLKRAIKASASALNIASPTDIVISTPTIDKDASIRILNVLQRLGYNKEHAHIISRSEAYIYYAMSQAPDLRNNSVGLFSLEDNSLVYYEMKVNKKPKSTTVYAEKELMDESINIEILKNDAGAKLADRILLAAAERLLKNKIFSCIILTGKGFEEQDWAPEFMRFICNRRKVFVDDEVFARGAGFRGADIASEKPLFPFTCICEGRTEFSIYVDITQNDRVISLPILSIGDPWFDAERGIRVIPYNTKTIDFTIVPMDAHQRKIVRIPLDFLPNRPPKTSIVSIRMIFKTDDVIELTLKDEGFGELFPSTGKSVTQEVCLWD